jgi:hypothetical protein
VAAPAAPAAAAPAAPAAAGNWYDKFTADAFVDAYGSINYNWPKPQYPAIASTVATGAPGAGGNTFRAFDVAQGFAVNWIGVNAAYSSDSMGGTIGLRLGPGAAIYNGQVVPGSDNLNGMAAIKQAYATWKAADKLTLDFGKWDEPFGSEVADSQLNMDYTRSLLFWYAQPLFFTGIRATIPVADQFSIIAFAANGWNNTLDNNRGKTIGLQLMIKPADMATFYLGYATGPETTDWTAAAPPPGAPPGTTGGITDVPDANDISNWRHLVDFVADIDPTKELRFLVNADYLTEDLGVHHRSVYGANLAIGYQASDAFHATLRGEYFHDEHGDSLGVTPPGTDSVNVEDVTLTLQYTIASHLALMLDNRIDIADNPYFVKGALSDTSKNQFTTTLGVIASTK